MTKRLLFILVCVLMIASLFAACGKSPAQQAMEDMLEDAEQLIDQDMDGEETDDMTVEESDVASDFTKATPADSYGRYIEAKGNGYESISAAMEANAELSMTGALAILPVAMVDLSAIGLTLISDDIAASEMAGSILGMNDLSIQYDGVNFSLTYTNEGQTYIMEGQYDANTDSLTCSNTTGGSETMYLEYVKYNDGYAGQYYITNDDGSKTIIKVIVDAEDMGMGIDAGDAKPASIFKSAPADFTFVDDCATVFTMQDGVGYSKMDGEESSF